MRLLYTAIIVLMLSASAFAGGDKFNISAGIGLTGMELESLSNADVDITRAILTPYGSLDVRGCIAKFCPEIRIENSFSYSDAYSPITVDRKDDDYSNYYIKLPTMIPLKFLSYPTMITLDFSYYSISQGVSLKSDTYINNMLYDTGSSFTARYQSGKVRLYVDTPVVDNQSFFEHSYFGILYTKLSSPSGVKTGIAPYDQKLIVSSTAEAIGVFYDMRKDTVVEGLNFAILAELGIGEISVDEITIIPADFGNLYGLAWCNIDIGLEYNFSINSIYIGANAGMSYTGLSNLLGTADPSEYSLNTASHFRYYLSFNIAY